MSDIAKERLQQRLNSMSQAVDQSLANHNALIGRKLEIEETLKNWDELHKNEEVSTPDEQ